MPPKSRKPQRPPLTHFLCLPLLTPTSTPQLKSSLAHLKSVIDAITPVTEGVNANPETRKPQPQTRPLVPPAAFRPLGSLHLTLGVMSLKEPERLQGALKFLQELDLEAMLRDLSGGGRLYPEEEIVPEESTSESEAGQPTTPPDEARGDGISTPRIDPDEVKPSPLFSTAATGEKATLSTLKKPISPPPTSNPSPHTPNQPQSQPPSPALPTSALPLSSPFQPNPSQSPRQIPLRPLTASLSGLHSIPLAEPHRTSVLSTHPHDPTSRLLTFCLALLSAFKAAGFVLPEDRGLTLHATLVNTVYAKGPPGRGSGMGRGGKGGGEGSGGMGGRGRERGKITFDAREVLRGFNDGIGIAAPRSYSQAEAGRGISNATPTHPPTASPVVASTTSPGHPPAATATPAAPTPTPAPNTSKDSAFTFAPSIDLNRVQICAMGAKKLDPENDPVGLGERYIVVGERRILPDDGSMMEGMVGGEGRGER